MTFDRRTALGGIAASTVALAFPLVSRAQTGGTLDQIKQRGSLRIGVTQAPPWFSKDPKTGEWSAGFGISMGKAMASALSVKLDTVEVTWGTAIAALQANKIDIMYMLDATPERAQAVDFPQAPLLYYSLAVLARDDLPAAQWSDLDKSGVRIAVPQASSMDKFVTESLPQATIQRFPGNAEAIAAFQAGRADAVCLFHPRFWSPERSWAPAKSWCQSRLSFRPPAPRCARTTSHFVISSTTPLRATTRAVIRKNGTRSSWSALAWTRRLHQRS